MKKVIFDIYYRVEAETEEEAYLIVDEIASQALNNEGTIADYFNAKIVK